MQAARKKYGKDVYSKKYSELATEFGCEEFPLWLTRFRGNDDPSKEDEQENIELSDITECFCYLDYTLQHFSIQNPYLKSINNEQLFHILKFAIIFMYDT